MRRFWKIARPILKGAVYLLALIGAWSVFNTFRPRDFVFHDRTLEAVRSPDGLYSARLTRTTGPTVYTTRLKLARADGAGSEKLLLQYRDQEAPIEFVWVDPNTLRVWLPCQPAEFLVPAFHDMISEPSRRIIIEYRHHDRGCRLGRGTDWP